MLHRVWFLAAGIACVMLSACLMFRDEQYCQSGAKYASQCYTINEVEWQETQVRAEPPPERATEPSPGCALWTGRGPYMMPPPTSSGVARPTRPPLYVMSGACVTRRETAHGAK